MLQCLNAAFIKRREYSTVRIAAFVKQICTVALHAPFPIAAPLLAFVRQLSQRYPSVHQMMESEQDVITSGTYNPNVLDPEHSNPFATCAWELSLAKFHYSPRVAHQATDAASLKVLQLPLEAPERIRRKLLQDASEFHVATRRASKKHPLLAKENNSSSSSSSSSRNHNKRQRQERFITANKTANYHLL
jgi:nucleolar complex protein 3